MISAKCLVKIRIFMYVYAFTSNEMRSVDKQVYVKQR